MTTTFAYDALEYPTYIHPQMHPSRLAAIARLHGVAAASPRRCKVLEIGCGSALQLLALAQAYPDSHFVGLDLSHSAVAKGDALRKQAGIDNAELVCADLLEWDPGDAAFDYILAHGFHSWVPPQVRGRLLALCATRLSPDGVAYISYNALPGNHFRQMIRKMLTFHLDLEAPPEQQIEQAARFLAWFDHSLGKPGDGVKEGYLAAAKFEVDQYLKELPPALLFHDDLAPCNTPFLFADFMAEASAHGLGYLGEADYFETSDLFLGGESRAQLDAFAGSDRIAREQYLDFLKGRRFRQTLLIRARDALPTEALAIGGMEILGALETEPGDDAKGTRFINATGAALLVTHPGIEAGLRALVGSQHPVPFAYLLEHAGIAAGSALHEELAKTVLFGFQIGLLTLACDSPAYARTPGARPAISALARAQLAMGERLFASLRPAAVRIHDPLALELMRLLDGTRDRDMLLSALLAWREAHPDPENTAPITPEALEDSLEGLAYRAMLVA